MRKIYDIREMKYVQVGWFEKVLRDIFVICTQYTFANLL